MLTEARKVQTGLYGISIQAVPLAVTLAISIDIVAKYALPPLVGNINSHANYAVTLLVGFAALLSMRQIVLPWPIFVVLIASLLNVTLSTFGSIYYSAIYFSFVCSALVAYNSDRRYGFAHPEWVAATLFVGAIGQMLFLYATAGIPSMDSYFGGWVFQGYPFGITKASLGVFASLCVLWALAHSRYLTFLALLILFSPLFLSTRTISVVLVLLVAAHLLGRISKSGSYIGPLCWGLMLATIAGTVFAGTFDRLPSYAIGLDLLLSTFWGIGHRQYAPFIYENFDALNAYYQHLMSPGITQVFIGAESMYADLLATHGVLSIPIFGAFFYTMAATFRSYRRMTAFERWVTLTWAFLMLGGIAQDLTHLNFLFYLIFGLAVSAAYKYREATSSDPAYPRSGQAEGVSPETQTMPHLASPVGAIYRTHPNAS